MKLCELLEMLGTCDLLVKGGVAMNITLVHSNVYVPRCVHIVDSVIISLTANRAEKKVTPVFSFLHRHHFAKVH